MLPTRKNQGWLPSIFNDFFDNDWMEKANATAPAINVVEHENDYCIRAGRGEGLLCAGRNRIAVEIRSSDTEFDLITTDRESLAKRVKSD